MGSSCAFAAGAQRREPAPTPSAPSSTRFFARFRVIVSTVYLLVQYVDVNIVYVTFPVTKVTEILASTTVTS